MAPASTTAESLAQSLVESYAVNDHMNQVILKHLDPNAWRAKPSVDNGRTIAAIFSHVHNIRRKWLRLSAPHIRLPGSLNRHTCSQHQTSLALAESAALCCEMIAEALLQPEGRVKTFRRDALAKPWPVGGAMVCYMISHDAHHRGQVCMLATRLGFPMPFKGAHGIWVWEQLWKECGFTRPR